MMIGNGLEKAMSGKGETFQREDSNHLLKDIEGKNSQGNRRGIVSGGRGDSKKA